MIPDRRPQVAIRRVPARSVLHQAAGNSDRSARCLQRADPPRSAPGPGVHRGHGDEERAMACIGVVVASTPRLAKKHASTSACAVCSTACTGRGQRSGCCSQKFAVIRRCRSGGRGDQQGARHRDTGQKQQGWPATVRCFAHEEVRDRRRPGGKPARPDGWSCGRASATAASLTAPPFVPQPRASATVTTHAAPAHRV